MTFSRVSNFPQHLGFLTTQFNTAEVDLLTRSGSVANPIAKDLSKPPGKTSTVKVQS